MDLSSRREQYESEGIDAQGLSDDPFDQFEIWYRQAEAADLWDPNACVAATVDSDGWPSARYVLLKAFDLDGFVFFTNYDSYKAAAFATTGRAALTFGWLPLRRQVRIVGSIEETSAEESDQYFASRPRGSQIAASASPQSREIPDRAHLEAMVAEARAASAEADVPRPPYWGGYRVRPHSIEFWQGRPDRLHDRIRYDLNAGSWSKARLAP
ncbi:MAG: pyridoxamine 5'-phosphate oxidase [Acidimicrobiales bacterium]